MTIRKIAEGAFFVPSYSEQTVVPFQPSITNQTITARDIGDETVVQSIEVGEGDTFTKGEFGKALRKVSVKVK